MTDPNYDPFAEGEKTPAISFKDAPIGTVKSIKITEFSKSVQSTDFETGKPAVWPDGNAKMSAVLKGEDPATGEPLSLWAGIPSAMLRAIGDAQKAIDPKYRIKPGDLVHVKYDADKPNSNPRLNAQKLYVAKIVPGIEAPKTEDPWATASPATSTPTAASSGFGDEPPF